MSQNPSPYQQAGPNPPSGQNAATPYDAAQYAQPAYGQPAHQAGYPQSAYGQPAYGQPAYGQPAYGQPAYGQPAYAPAPVSKPTGWFVVNWLFFWPIAIYSLVSHWNKIDPAAYSGDIAGAQFHAAKVRKLGILALCLGVGLTVLIIILDVVVFATVVSNTPYYNVNP